LFSNPWNSTRIFVLKVSLPTSTTSSAITIQRNGNSLADEISLLLVVARESVEIVRNKENIGIA
jgi:hypothetical protein